MPLVWDQSFVDGATAVGVAQTWSVVWAKNTHRPSGWHHLVGIQARLHQDSGVFEKYTKKYPTTIDLSKLPS